LVECEHDFNYPFHSSAVGDGDAGNATASLSKIFLGKIGWI